MANETRNPIRYTSRAIRISLNESPQARIKGCGTPKDAISPTAAPQTSLRGLRKLSASGAARAQRGAHAYRRSTAALAAANQRHRSAPGALPGTWLKDGRYPPPPVPVQRSQSQTGHDAGRALSRSRPGAMVTSLRPREPRSLRRPVSPAGVLYASETARLLIAATGLSSLSLWP